MISLPVKDDFKSEKEYLKALSKCIEDIRIHNLNNPDNIVEASKKERLLELKNNLGIE